MPASCFAGCSYTYTDTDLPSQINGFGAQSYLPDHVADADRRVRFLDEKLTVGARVSYSRRATSAIVNAGRRFNVYADPFMPAYALVDLFSSYKFDNGFEARRNCDQRVRRDLHAAPCHRRRRLFTPQAASDQTTRAATSCGTARTHFLYWRKAQFCSGQA